MLKLVTSCHLALLAAAFPLTANEQAHHPYGEQVAQRIARLHSDSPEVRAGACEALGFLRAYPAQDALIASLADPSPLVRRQAALALAWCGHRDAVKPLLTSLDDDDWVTRQAAHVALTNLTGMEFSFDALAPSADRAAQATVWRDWWSSVPADRPPTDVLKLIRVARPWSVSVSSTYKGPPDVLIDGRVGPEYWQTKSVALPQWCIIDLGGVTEISRVVVHQYGPDYAMTEYELATSLDKRTFKTVESKRIATPARLVIDFPKRKTRYVRITSLGAKRPLYPTTFYEIEIGNQSNVGNLGRETRQDTAAWQLERGLRALGVLGGRQATTAVLAALGPQPNRASGQRLAIRAGIRALGRLGDDRGFDYLVRLLDDPMWARYAAEALGDIGQRRAAAPLLAAYLQYCKTLDGKDPPDVPPDDRMRFPSEDRMLDTPYAIAFALCRLPLDDPQHRAMLKKTAPLLMANLPGDHDAMMLYEPEVGHLLTRYLMEASGLRQQACEHALEGLGQARRLPRPAAAPRWPRLPEHRIASWLPAICTDREDVPRLLALLEHNNGWVRLNAAKTLGWLGDPRAAAPIARMLALAKAEAHYGWSGKFKDEEFNDPAPRWREGAVRALGMLGTGEHATEHAELFEGILNDQRSVLDVRHAAAHALATLGGDEALNALCTAARSHDFHSVQHTARDALRFRGIALPAASIANPRQAASSTSPCTASWTPEPGGDELEAIVFIKGDNDIPNTKGTVEQADRWRQTYVVTDSGPVYRPGRNLYVLRPPRPAGKVTPLTKFADGYVGEPELSWDATHVIFTHRGQNDPWWHLYRICIDGSGLEQLTDGPYHDVGPAYLPDGRIVFASSRSGIRDEYHGYPCTALYVMQADGSDMQPIATNIGRDNEPAILADGRIVFSRLEVFYSRNKTELTLHAVYPDGTHDRVLYGPERRRFWRDLDHGPRTPADGQEAPLTHRVLRMTQPQPMPDGRHIIVATQGGLALVGSRRDAERIITPDNKTRAYTTPWPLPNGRILCASTRKVSDRQQIDLGLYLLDPASKQLELIYNDPQTADFEARPIVPRKPPPLLPGETSRGAYSGRFLCTSVFATQEQQVRQRGRLVRLIEGVPVVGRHSTQTNPMEVWQNHGGTLARVLGTAPLAADGSFFMEVPADRLLHLQVLDSDRQVVGNQLTWIYARPGETRSCVGCHERRDTTVSPGRPLAASYPPIPMLPSGDEFNYRAKAWFKGHLPDEIEERTRTVRAVNLLGR